MGDNRDCSKDSRFLNDVGYVNSLNLVGKLKSSSFLTTQIEEVCLNFGT